MSPRPTRESAKAAIAKIRDVLAWESCSESNDTFKAAAAKMELEFANAKRRRVTAAEKTLDEDDDEDDEDDEDDASSDCDSDASGSVPSSADLFSDPGDSSEDDGSALSEDTSSGDEDAPDVAVEVSDSPV